MSNEGDGGTGELQKGEALDGAVYQHPKDGRMIVYGETEYVPASDLAAMKDSLTKQRDDALAGRSQIEEALKTKETEASDLKSRLELSSGTIDEARKQILATQSNLSAKEASIRKEAETLQKEREAFALSQSAYTRERLAKEHGVDIELLRPYNDPKDMEIAALKEVHRKTTEGSKGKPPVTPPAPGGGNISGGPTDPLAAAKKILQTQATRVQRPIGPETSKFIK